jgi:hypothetical protein
VTVCRDYTPFGGAKSRANAIAVAVSDARGTPGSWVFKDVSFDNAAYGLGVPVDPNVVLWRPEQNLVRMFVSQFSGADTGATHSYTSTDGFTFHYEGARYAPGPPIGMIDPENFRFDDKHWYILSGGPHGVATSSDDGMTFTKQGFFHNLVTNVSGYTGTPHDITVTDTPGMYRTFTSILRPGTNMSGIDSLRSAAIPWMSWQWEGPVLDVVPGFESCEVRFPTVVRLAADDWAMFYGTIIPNCACAESTLYHCSPLGGGAGPRALSVEPGATSGTSGIYTFTFSDSNGWQAINVANILINNFVDGRGACYVAVVPSGAGAGSVYLVDDAGNAGGPYQGMVLPGSGMVQNSQCSISGAGSSMSGSGNNLTVTLAITFKAAFAGNRIVYTAAREAAGANSGWQALGTCAIPGNAPSGPAVGGVAPARSAGPGGATFVLTFSDTNGWQDLGVVNILINDALNGNNACYLAYSRAYNTLYLVNDPGTGLLPGLSLNGAGTLNNGQCTITGAGSMASGSGNTLTLTLNMTFPQAFAGNRIIYMAARSNGDALNSGWQAAGTRSVQ